MGEYGNKYYKTTQFGIINDCILFFIQRMDRVNNIKNNSVIKYNERLNIKDFSSENIKENELNYKQIG